MTRTAEQLAARPNYRNYLVALLAIILGLNGLDGTALGLVLPNIKSALYLTDTELGLLTGIAFSLFYSTVGVPLGRWADRGDRVVIITLTTALWGVMVMWVGAAKSFGELLIARVGVAVGEAGCVPAAYSLIADYFEREERPRAVSNYLLGGVLSVIAGYLAAGWLSYHYGWRAMFVLIGIPSLMVAPVAWWTLSEPRRNGQRALRSQSRVQAPGMLHVIEVLWQNRTFRYLLAVTSLNALFGSGIGVWQPSFFSRSYGFHPEALGLFFGLVYGIGGAIGLYLGGYLTSRYAARNERLQLRVFALCNSGFGLLAAFIYLSRDSTVSVVLLALAVVGGALENGPVFATAQTVVPGRMRAISISVIYLFANLLGAGVGPLVVGALSDRLNPYFGAESLRYSLLAMCPGYFMAGWMLWRASHSVIADTEAAAREEGEPTVVTCVHA